MKVVLAKALRGSVPAETTAEGRNQNEHPIGHALRSLNGRIMRLMKQVPSRHELLVIEASSTRL